jgi:cytochrome oxidase assembly protein ShyY1
VLKIPNNHLSYALTWFALAATLLAVALVFMARGGKSAPAHDSGQRTR